MSPCSRIYASLLKKGLVIRVFDGEAMRDLHRFEEERRRTEVVEILLDRLRAAGELIAEEQARHEDEMATLAEMKEEICRLIDSEAAEAPAVW